MNDISLNGDIRMTIHEVAEILGVTDEAIRWNIRKLFPDKMKNGIKTLLSDAEVTEIKSNMIPTSALVASVTRTEKDIA